jgi:predicted ATPase/transcriptional regulator with XRE-family HTH domain
MAADPVPTFGGLLKRHRMAAGLSQEALAERAQLSARAISDLERGLKLAPRRDTVALLAEALALSSEESAALEATVSRRRAPRATAAATPPAMEDGFPLLVSPAAPQHNLPLQVDSFVGRQQAQQEVQALLDRSPLVTLTGTGGVGKTRLALAVAAAAVDSYPDGVWLVELAPLADPSLVAQAVATVLGVREEPGRPLLATLTDHVQPRALLLVLDNCEHLIGVCAELAVALLRQCPGLRLLATSREALAVAGETQYRVPALAVPDLAHLPHPEHLSAVEAVDLFMQRAQARHPDFALTSHNAPVVAQICARLDGLPLAIELAAARAGSLPLEAIAARLDDRLQLLTGGSRTALPRHQTLRAAMEWSHDLLSAPEQTLLRRLAVFSGGWSLGAAETVCAGTRLASWEVLDLLAGLVNKSLVLLEERGGEARYRLLETVRHYGQERLEAAGEAAAVREDHLAWCLALAEEAQPQLRGPQQGLWLARLEADHDNLREALGWSLREGGDATLSLRLAGALWRFWYTRGYLGEGQGWLARALAADQGPPAARATALNGAAALAIAQGEHGPAATMYEEALALWRALGDTRGVAESLGNLGNVMVHQGEYGRAAALHEEALALFRSLGHEEGIAQNLANLGAEAYMQGEYGRAAVLHEEALSLRRAMGDAAGIANSLNYLGLVAYMQCEYGRAAALYREALGLRYTLGDRRGIAAGLIGLGLVAYMQGEYGRAAALCEEGLLLSRDIGARDLVAGSLEGLAWVAAARGQSQVAAHLGGAAAALREALGALLLPDDWAGHDQAVRAMRTALGEDAFAAVWAEGRALPLEQAIALAQEHGELTVLRSDAAAAT